MTRNLVLAFLSLVALTATARPLETTLEFDLKTVKGLPEDVTGIAIVRTSDIKRGNVETDYRIRITWKTNKGKESKDFPLESNSGDADYNEFVIKGPKSTLEKLDLYYVTVQNFLEWAHLSRDNSVRIETERLHRRHRATIEITYSPEQKTELIKRKVFRTKRFKGNTVSLNYLTGRNALLLTEDPKPQSTCYRGTLEEAAELLEQLVKNAAGEEGSMKGIAIDHSALRAQYTLYDEDGSKDLDIKLPPCK